MLVKVSELEGRALNFAVALVQWGIPETIGNPNQPAIYRFRDSNGDVAADVVIDAKLFFRGMYGPQGNWAHGGPLIDKYDIWLMSGKRDVTDHTWWRAYPLGGASNQNLTAYHRPLRAAMISLVWFKNGSEEIEIPDVLMG